MLFRQTEANMTLTPFWQDYFFGGSSGRFNISEFAADQNLEGKKYIYSLIAFDERVIFWLQRVRSLPCACAYVALFARRLAYNHYAIAHACNAANAHEQGSDPAR